MEAPVERPRILLIDDMPSIHEDFRKLFMPAPTQHQALDDDEALLFGSTAPAVHSACELDSAYQGREGLERLQQACAAGRPYALAFVDMRMPPGWDGIETIERLWQVDPRLQVVICTAYTEHSWTDVLQRLDAGDRLLILKKPFDPIEVQQLVRSLSAKWALGRTAEAQLDTLEAAVRSRTRELMAEVEARREAELALRVRERAIEAAVSAVVITDSARPDHPIEYVNPAFERITGYKAADAVGRNARFLHRGDDDQPGLEALRAAVRAGRDGHGIFRSYRQDGTIFWSDVRVAPVRDEGGRITHYIGVFSDVTAAREHEDRLEFQARHDALTGLPNRILLRDRLEQAVAMAQRNQTRLAVLWLDLDHFKYINDTYGHQVGDALLIGLSQRLRQSVRQSDTVARLGGDEFVILLPGIAREADAGIAAKKLLAALEPAFEIEGTALHASTSIGISTYPDDGQGVDELLMHADIAMYRAKSEGRNGYHFYSRELSQRARERETLAQALRGAAEAGQFELHYQPKLDLASTRVTGVEALLRWRHPELGMVSPAIFIPIAEETGLIVSIGVWVLRQACAQAVAWEGLWPEDATMAVNVSARQFRQNDMPATVLAVLAETGLAPRRLALELTESLLMQTSDSVVQALHAIRALGVTLSLDDFGTGFASLSYLQRFPLDEVKIDRSFVSGAAGLDTDSAVTQAITQAIIGMAHALGLSVVAEGVESAAQLAYLRERHCDAAQGYLLGRPVPAAALTAQWSGKAQLPGGLAGHPRRAA